jgi:hypothetical protein
MSAIGQTKVSCPSYSEPFDLGCVVPIRDFLNGDQFDPETTRVMGVAFEMARAAMRLTDQPDPNNNTELVANRIIALAKAGERNPDALCERALAGLGKLPPT